MPFPLRTVGPLKRCRLEEDGAAPRDKEGHAGRGGGGGAGLLLGSLEEVSSHSLVSLLGQLSDLSRCASEVFGGIQEQADSLGRRSVRLQRRLDGLRSLVSRLDHRKVKILVKICIAGVWQASLMREFGDCELSIENILKRW
ncbi:UNVERIFIED_CONTAM: hypothetical protein K2H54_074230 [Gekko kuhli]